MPRKGTSPAFLYIAQQLGNGAIVERLISGRSFFDVRACGEGSKGYVGKRDAHNFFCPVRPRPLGSSSDRSKSRAGWRRPRLNVVQPRAVSRRSSMPIFPRTGFAIQRTVLRKFPHQILLTHCKCFLWSEKYLRFLVPNLHSYPLS